MFQAMHKDVYGIAAATAGGAVLAMKEPLGIFVCDGHYPFADLLRSGGLDMLYVMYATKIFWSSA